MSRQSGTLPNLVLALILVAAQSVVSAHVLQHETGSAQNQVCTSCVAANQLGAATVDNGMVYAISVSTHEHVEASVTFFDSIHTLTIRQRGPPAAL